MKKSIATLSVATVFTLGLTSCDKLKDKLFPSFEANAGVVQLTVPVITNTSTEASLGSQTVHFNLDSTVQDYTKGRGDFSISNVNSVKVKNVSVMLTSPYGDDSNNLSNFENAKVTLASNTNTTPVVIASASIADSYSSSLNIANDNSPELKEYLKGSDFIYTVSGKPRRATHEPMNLVITVTLKVD
jgi:hypothetical protein